jgi:TonB family protein
MVATLAAASNVVGAQQKTIQDQPYHQAPDKDGVYFVGPEVSAPLVVHAVPAIQTDEMLKSKNAGMSVWSAVIRGNGTVTDLELVHPLGAAFDAAAIEAIKRSGFEPGELNGKPVAVRVGLAVPFRYGKYPSTPVIGIFERDLDPGVLSDNLATTRPIAIHTASWSFSSDAIQAKYQGVSLISVLVGEDGIPGEARIVRAVGMGLDQMAIDAVRRYRFRPAMREGIAVPAQINVEVKFLLY